MEEINNIDLNLCKSFLAVAKSGSISKAADMLYVSQPAVSHNIKMLEDRLECKLFNRTAKGVELTADAEKLMYYIENAYNTIKTGFKVLNDSNDLLKGEVRIGVPTHICVFLVSDIIEAFNKNYPGIKFSIVNRSTAEMVDMLEKRELDVIIDSYPIDSAREDIIVDDLLEVDNCFVASNKYTNLINNNKVISIDELAQYPLLLQQAKTSTRKALDSIRNNSQERFEPNIEVATTEVMLDLVRKGLGIGYFARMSVMDRIQSKELIEIPIKEELPKTKIGIVYIKEFLTNAPKKFVEIIKEKSSMLNELKKKTIRLILLQDCVYNCSFCHKEGIKTKRESLLTPEDIGYMFSVLNNRYGIKTVQLTGGEPLLRKDLKDIIINLKKHGANVKVTTNGHLLKENMWIGEMVDKLNISVHSLNEKKYEGISTVEGSYEKVISAIKQIRFKYPTLKISINTTLLKGINDSFESIQELINFASSIKADLKIVEVYPITSKYFTSISNMEPLIKQLGYKQVKNSFRKAIYFNGTHNIFLQRCTCSIVSEQTDKTGLCRENNDIYISQDGKINLCRSTNGTIDLYDDIKSREDDELASKIKKTYEKMGSGCGC